MRFSIAFLILWHCSQLFAQWQSLLGPEGGNISQLFETSGHDVYATSAELLFIRKSDDLFWNVVSGPFENNPVLSISENQDGIIFVGIHASGKRSYFISS